MKPLFGECAVGFRDSPAEAWTKASAIPKNLDSLMLFRQEQPGCREVESQASQGMSVSLKPYLAHVIASSSRNPAGFYLWKLLL